MEEEQEEEEQDPEFKHKNDHRLLFSSIFGDSDSEESEDWLYGSPHDVCIFLQYILTLFASLLLSILPIWPTSHHEKKNGVRRKILTRYHKLDNRQMNDGRVWSMWMDSGDATIS